MRGSDNSDSTGEPPMAQLGLTQSTDTSIDPFADTAPDLGPTLSDTAPALPALPIGDPPPPPHDPHDIELVLTDGADVFDGGAYGPGYYFTVDGRGGND